MSFREDKPCLQQISTVCRCRGCRWNTEGPSDHRMLLKSRLSLGLKVDAAGWIAPAGKAKRTVSVQTTDSELDPRFPLTFPGPRDMLD